MKIVPFINLEGRPSILSRSHRRGELTKLAEDLAEEYDRVFVSDGDGITKNRPQLNLAREICEEIPVLYEGGVRFAQNVIDMLITGAERAVIGTSTLANLEELRGAFKLSENITFKVDSDNQDGILSFDPQIAGRAFHELASEVCEIGIREIIVSHALAMDGAEAKRKLGFSLGVQASVKQASALEALGADFVIASDYGSLGKDE